MKVNSMSSQKELSVFIYVLKLVEDKYYIGRTDKELPKERVLGHFRKEGGSRWTQKYSPIGIEEILKGCNTRMEDYITKIYMDKYGVDNVRGGTYCQLDIEDSLRKFLKKEELTARNLCYRCEKPGHKAANCFKIEREKDRVKEVQNAFMMNFEKNRNSAIYDDSVVNLSKKEQKTREIEGHSSISSNRRIYYRPNGNENSLVEKVRDPKALTVYSRNYLPNKDVNNSTTTYREKNFGFKMRFIREENKDTNHEPNDTEIMNKQIQISSRLDNINYAQGSSLFGKSILREKSSEREKKNIEREEKSKVQKSQPEVIDLDDQNDSLQSLSDEIINEIVQQDQANNYITNSKSEPNPNPEPFNINQIDEIEERQQSESESESQSIIVDCEDYKDYLSDI